jgi:hypothetical protein
MPEKIRQVVYSSGSTGLLTPQDLAEILQVARRNNLAADITGMLVYRRGHFLQVLEGPDERLAPLLAKLLKDPRHHHLQVLLDGYVGARAFGAWSMAFGDVSGLEPDDLPAFSRFLTNGFTSTECVRFPQQALRMVLAFRDMNLGR